MTGQSQGAQAKLAMDASSFDTNSEAFEFLSESLVAVSLLADNSSQAIRGTRSHSKERVTQGLVHVRGRIAMNPTALDLDKLLPRIFGATESSDTFALDETIPPFNVMVDRVAKVFTYSTCYVDKAIIRGRKGQFIELILEIIGTSESEGAAGTYPNISIDTGIPYVFHQGVMSLQSSSRNFDEFVVTIDNHLEVEFNNSQTATDIHPRDRTITLSTSTPYTSTETDLYTTPAGSASGALGTLTFTGSGISTLFSFANLKSLARTPRVGGKRQIRLPLHYKAYKSGATNELIVTHDSTP